MTLLPAVTGSGESELVTETSACAVTLVVAVAALLADVGSGVSLETVPVLLIIVPSAMFERTVPMIVIVAEAPAAIDEIDTLRLLPVPPQTPPPVALQDTKLNSTGRLSTIVNNEASLGPALLTVNVYVTLLPTSTGSGESVLLMDRSARLFTVVDVVAELFPVTGSGSGPATRAVLLIVAPWAEPERTAATRVIVADDPAASDGKVIVRLLPEPPQTPLVETHETKVTSAGRLSMTVTGAASLGPELLMVIE